MELVSVDNVVSQVFADFTSTLTVDITVLRDDVVRSISCGSAANTAVLDIPILAVQGWLILIMSVYNNELVPLFSPSSPAGVQL